MAYGFSVTIKCDGERPHDIGSIVAGVSGCGEYVASDTHVSTIEAAADAEARAAKLGWQIDRRSTYCAAHKRPRPPGPARPPDREPGRVGA